MDVKYTPSDWENTKKGIGHLIGLGAWGKGMIDSLKDISENLEDAQSDIAKYDVDGAISFSHTGHKGVYQGIYEDFRVLYDFAGKVGDIVDRTIDEPFYKDIDAFATAMRDLSITDVKTKNRIGAKETVVIPGGYSSNTMEVPKAEVSLEDLFSGSNAYAKQMKEEYDNWKLQNPDEKISEKDYEQAVLHSRAFQYDSIHDGQEKKEFWGQIAALTVIVGASIICPPAGMALGIAYGTLELESAVSGKDWISGRELGTGERVFRGVLAPLDIVPGVSGLAKFSSTVRMAHLGDVTELGLKTGIKAGIQRESRHVANMVIDAGKDSAARIRSAKAWAKEVPAYLKKGAENGAIGAARLADNAATFMKNGLPTRQMGLASEGGGRVDIPAENAHAAENKIRSLLSKMDKINVGERSNHSFAENMSEEDAQRYQQYWDYVNEKINTNNRVVLSRSNGFAKQIVEQLKKYKISIEEFHKMKIKPIYEMTDSEINIMKSIRDSVPKITQETLLQKTFPTGDIEKYLSGKYKEIGGYFAKEEDVSHIKDYAHVVESSRLDYSYVNNDSVVRPFPENRNSYGKILFRTEHIESIEIPYGKRMGGTVFDDPPCTQNGFTASRNGEIVPEWKFNGYFAPKDGAELFEVIDGKKILRAVYDEDFGRFIQIK